MDTRSALIDQAISIVRRTGFAGFSYADLSAVVGISKPTIHHYFPAKSDLGVAMVESYRALFAEQLSSITASERQAAKRLKAYCDLYRTGVIAGSGCLCGVLAAEFAILPPDVQKSVQRFFDDNITWLEHVLSDGRGDGTIRREGGITRQARMVLSTLQGALVIARPTADVAYFDDAGAAMLAAFKA